MTGIYRDFMKRLLDIVLSSIGLLMMAPVILLIGLFLYFANRPASAFFVQSRPGRNAKIFRVIKFKTMNDKRDSSGNILPDELRLTRIGKFIRATSLDELPQLINVLKGDMSLIGPRPLLVKYLPLYSSNQARRHDVRPGITGWAQVNGRNAISWEQKFKLDVWYVEHLTFILDLKIIFLTLVKIFKREGIYRDGDITSMEAFNGKQLK